MENQESLNLEPADYEIITKKLEIFNDFTQDFSCDMGKVNIGG